MNDNAVKIICFSSENSFLFIFFEMWKKVISVHTLFHFKVLPDFEALSV